MPTAEAICLMVTASYPYAEKRDRASQRIFSQVLNKHPPTKRTVVSYIVTNNHSPVKNRMVFTNLITPLLLILTALSPCVWLGEHRRITRPDHYLLTPTLPDNIRRVQKVWGTMQRWLPAKLCA